MSRFLPNLVEAAEDLVRLETTCLPRDERQADSRARGLAQHRATYRFNYTHVSPLAICDAVPIRDEFSFGWLKVIVERVLVALANRAELETISELRDYHHARHRLVKSLFAGGLDRVREIKQVAREALRLENRIGASREHAEDIGEYAALFRTIGLPGIARNFMDDAQYAEQRVAGPNPVMLRRLTAPDDRLPLTEALFQVGAPGDSLAAAFAEARVYLADYALLDGAEAGDFPNGQKYLAAPLALFVVNKATGRLQPVAIQCHQRPGPDNPVFTPRDGWNWTIAKTFVEIADGNVHEALTHLGRTHLSMEPFVVSTYRQLAGNHPLHLLLQPHFEGTLAINEAAWRHLIASRGAVEKLFSASLPVAQGLAASGVREQQIMQSLLPLTFRDRGVDDTSALPHYPYRDDALLYWNAIRPWVESYSRLYYGGDRDVAEDVELQAWVRELSAPDGGRLSGLPQGGQKIETRSELTDLLTFVVFTCSVQHAAVNFPQYDHMSYAPNMPLAAYQPPPTKTTGATEADYLKTLPTLDMAELQMELGYLLGTAHYTELGGYSAEAFGGDLRVASLVNQFQASLRDLGDEIERRNAIRPVAYTTLVPSGIPQSINV